MDLRNNKKRREVNKKMAKNYPDTIIDTLGDWYAKTPSLPKNVKDILVKITPILALVFGILGVLGAIAGLGLLTVFSPLAALGGVNGVSSYGGGFIAALFLLASSILLLAAFPGTKARKKQGWNLLFWSEMVGLIGSIVSLSFFSGIIGALIGFYLLFQIKSYYK